MTKEEYNELLARFNRAERWYNSNPPKAEQEKFLGNYMEIINQLNKGVLELKPNADEILGGFKL